MTSVEVKRKKFTPNQEAIDCFEKIHDEWELNVCEKYPHDALVGGEKFALTVNNYVLHFSHNSSQEKKIRIVFHLISITIVQLNLMLVTSNNLHFIFVCVYHLPVTLKPYLSLILWEHILIISIMHYMFNIPKQQQKYQIFSEIYSK